MELLSKMYIDQVSGGITANYVVPLSGAIDMAVFTWAGAAFGFGYGIGTLANDYFGISDQIVDFISH